VLQPLDVHLPASRCDYTIAGTHEQLGGFDASEHPAVHTAMVEFGDQPRLSSVSHGARYDMVVASDVLAAKANPRALLTAMRDWLAPGALVVISEARRSRFSDIVFNLVLSFAGRSHASARRGRFRKRHTLHRTGHRP
jgi:phthiocerol/phenolphthiocerol synthesis type-I polyketide synthase C